LRLKRNGTASGARKIVTAEALDVRKNSQRFTVVVY
jgi:hypothetical protein